MMAVSQPWGLSGPEFTGLYVVGFVVSLVIVFGGRALLSRQDFRTSNTNVPLVDVYQAAFLAGGPRRVVDTAIVTLALHEQVLVARGGRITAVTGAAVSGPIESAVYQELHPAESRPALHRRLRDHPAVTSIGDHLRAQGLLLNDSRQLLWRLVVLAPVAVGLIGVARAVNGAYLHRPIGNLVALLVMTAAVIFFLLRIGFSAQQRPSPRGREAVRRVRQECRECRGAATGVLRGATWEPQVVGVAVLGFTGLTDPDLRAALFSPTGNNWGGDSGGAGAGCGGGGGGGGCGG